MATIALAGGGTGGHVYPALAIGEVLIKRGHDLIYYGDPDRLEGRVVPERGLPFRPLKAPQYPRGVLGKIKFALGLLGATIRIRSTLKQDGVDLVLGVGGYISAPTVLAAASLGLRCAVHEANVVPGKANRLLGRVSHLVLLTYERTRSLITTKAPIELVGVPVNPSILGADKALSIERYGLNPSRPVALFVGGSLGARRINELAIACAQDSLRLYQIIHVSGPRFYEEVMATLGGEMPDAYSLISYEEHMSAALAAADLVVCRSGSSTLGELAATGCASLLIPSPHVTDNHQEENARGLESVGAAEVLLEGSWDIQQSVETVSTLMGDAGKLSEMGRAALGQARLDAAPKAANLIEALL